MTGAAPPGDRLREAIQSPVEKVWIAWSLALLAMMVIAAFYSTPDISAALPPAAAVLIVTVCSVAKRVR
jgi:hypothetical protein